MALGTAGEILFILSILSKEIFRAFVLSPALSPAEGCFRD
jgi:hypothetical protein